MKSVVCAMYDRKAKSYGPPMVFQNEDMALRMAQNLMATVSPQSQSDLERYPQDFDLFLIGAYDNETGVIVRVETPQYMFTFGDLLQQKAAQ